jgi:hypothetical protein
MLVCTETNFGKRLWLLLFYYGYVFYHKKALLTFLSLTTKRLGWNQWSEIEFQRQGVVLVSSVPNEYGTRPILKTPVHRVSRDCRFWITAHGRKSQQRGSRQFADYNQYTSENQPETLTFNACDQSTCEEKEMPSREKNWRSKHKRYGRCWQIRMTDKRRQFEEHCATSTEDNADRQRWKWTLLPSCHPSRHYLPVN